MNHDDFEIPGERQRMWFHSEIGTVMTILRIKHTPGFSMDSTKVEMGDGSKWNCQIHNERTQVVPAPI
jgi:hypothetical protein